MLRHQGVIVNDWSGEEGKWKYSADLDVKIVLSLNDVLTIHWYLLLLSLTRYIVCTCVLFSSFNHFLAKTVEIRCIFYRVTKKHA